MLGADTVIYAHTESGERVVASIRGIHPIAEGSAVSYAVDHRFIHVFDSRGDALTPLRSWSNDYIEGVMPTTAESARLQSVS